MEANCTLLYYEIPNSSVKKRKEELCTSIALILGDFAENYKFVVQDEVQSFHWNSLQCTVYPTPSGGLLQGR